MFILFCNFYLKKHNMRNVDNSEPCLESQQLLTALKILQYFRHITGAPPRRPKRICLKQIFSACLTTLYRDLAKGIMSVYLPCEAKNCPVLFLQYLYQTYLYSDNFRHTYSTRNLLSSVYFTFFIKSNTGNQLKFQQYSALAHCSHTVLNCFVARCRMSS